MTNTTETKNIPLHFYVMVPEKQRIVWVDIFSIDSIYKSAIKAAEKYYSGLGTIEDVQSSLKTSLRRSVFAKKEYSVNVRSSEYEIENHFNIDAYNQLLPNLKMLAMYVLQLYVS